MISLTQVHPWKEILQEPEKEEEEKNKEDEKENEKEREKDEEKEKQKGEDEKNKEEEEKKKEEKYKEKEEPVTSGDNDLHDILDNLLTKLLAIKMETLDTEKERINQETQPGTEG